MNSPGKARPLLWSPNIDDLDVDNNCQNNLTSDSKKIIEATNSKAPTKAASNSYNDNNIKNIIVDDKETNAKGTTQNNTRYSPTIKEIPLEDRPRERLISIGAQALTTAELMAILIHIGNSERSAVSLAECILAHFGNISGVAGATVEELSLIKGIGNAKAAQILAAIEFGKRVTLFSAESKPQINNPRDVANILMPDLRYLKKETLKSLLLDSKNRILSIRTVSIGDLSSSIVHPREVFKDAVIASSASIIIAHNHPSGDPNPSIEDINITKRLMSAGELLGIELLDHIVIGDGTFVSIKERGLV